MKIYSIHAIGNTAAVLVVLGVGYTAYLIRPSSVEIKTVDAAPISMATLTSSSTILDLVNELKASSTSKKLPIFTSTKFEDGTACVMVYDSTKKTNYAPTALDPKDFVAPTAANPNPTLKQAFSNSTWLVSSWVVNQMYPNFCSSIKTNPTFDTSIFTQNNAAFITTNHVNTVNNAQGINFYQDKVVFANRSVEFWTTVFGSNLFRAFSDYQNVSWPNNFISKQMSTANGALLWLNQYHSLQFLFDAELSYANINTCCGTLPSNGVLPYGSQLTYDPMKHATQFRLALLLQYRITDAQKKSCSTLTPDPVCAHLEYNGKYMDYIIMFHDERYEYISQWKPSWLGGATPSKYMLDLGTNTMMYQESLENLMSSSQKSEWFTTKKQNPYKVTGNRFVLNVNIYSLLQSAILGTYSQIVSDPTTGSVVRALPNRLPGSGADGLETDSEYLSHFVISSANLGYEVPGLSQMTFTIHDFKLTAN